MVTKYEDTFSYYDIAHTDAQRDTVNWMHRAYKQCVAQQKY